MLNILKDRSPDLPVSQHFLSWGKYETVVQNPAKEPTSVVMSMASVNVLAPPLFPKARLAYRMPAELGLRHRNSNQSLRREKAKQDRT
jgi:hypothetical protein